MKKKVRDRLDHIEQALKNLIKEVGKLHSVPRRLANGRLDADISPALRKPKTIKKTAKGRSLRRSRISE